MQEQELLELLKRVLKDQLTVRTDLENSFDGKYIVTEVYLGDELISKTSTGLSSNAFKD